MNTEFQKMILSTVCFYDILDYPLTGFEVFKYLTSLPIKNTPPPRPSLAEVMRELDDKNLKRFIRYQNGFYFLRDRKEPFKRIEFAKIADRKLVRARRIAKILRFTPFVRMVAVTGRLAMKNTPVASDLDFLIILEGGRIWTGRGLAVLILHLLGLHRHGSKIRDRACLNFFVTTNSLEVPFKDLFSSHEYSALLPLFGKEIFSDFQRENGWIKKYRAAFECDNLPPLCMVSDTFLSRAVRSAGEYFLSIFDVGERAVSASRRKEAEKPRENLIERWARTLQRKRIKLREKRLQGTETEESMRQFEHLVQVSSKRLVFWPRRPKTMERFIQRLREVERWANAGSP